MGNVVLGNTNPTQKLDINGNMIRFSGNRDMYNGQGLYWGDDNYSIQRSPGNWTGPNYEQLEINFVTGIKLKTGNSYGKSFDAIDNALFVGSSYINTKPPNNGAIIQGPVGIGTSTIPDDVQLVVSGKIHLVGNNQTTYFYHSTNEDIDILDQEKQQEKS